MNSSYVRLQGPSSFHVIQTKRTVGREQLSVWYLSQESAHEVFLKPIIIVVQTHIVCAPICNSCQSHEQQAWHSLNF